MDTLEISGWVRFAERLKDVLRGMAEDQFLIVQVKDTNRFVQFAHQGAHGYRAEAVSNAFLTGNERLSSEDIGRIADLGWSAPTGNASQSTPMDDPEGSPNYFAELEADASLDELVEMTVRTLREVYGAPSVIFLEYAGLDADGEALHMPELRLRPFDPSLPVEEDLQDVVLEFLRAFSNIPDLEVDDGIMSLTRGDATVLFRVQRDEMLMFSVVAGMEEPGNPDVEMTNTLNRSTRGARFFWDDEYVMACGELPLAPFAPGLLHRGIEQFFSSVEEAMTMVEEAYYEDESVH